jgi:hypothetical protein
MALATIALTLAQIEVVWKIVVVDPKLLAGKDAAAQFISLVTNSARPAFTLIT